MICCMHNNLPFPRALPRLSEGNGLQCEVLETTAELEWVVMVRKNREREKELLVFSPPRSFSRRHKFYVTFLDRRSPEIGD